MVIVIIGFLACVLLGMFIGIETSYKKIIKDTKFSWDGEFYKVVKINIEESKDESNTGII
jgi:hypothetical protein